MTDICQCDANDKESLALFRMRRAYWKNWLYDDSVSISKQITYMLWRDSIFRTFNEARRLTIGKKSKLLGFNVPIIQLLDEGFVTLQVMTIRRLTDPSFYDPNRSVISLPRLIDDLSANAHILTRENYVAHDGSKYDDVSYDKNGIEWIHWKRKQESFDKLSGVSSRKRTRTDKIDIDIIKKLRNQLNVCNTIRTYVNKVIAHSSDPANRIRLSPAKVGVSLDKLEECYKAIICVASFVGAIILYEHALGGVPTPQYYHLNNLDKPMLSHNDIQKLHDYWERRVREVELWTQNLWTVI